MGKLSDSKGGVFRAEMLGPNMPNPPADQEYAPPVKVVAPAKPASAPKGKAPADKGIFTQEDLKQFGGSMKNPPSDPEGVPNKPKKFAKGGKVRGGGCEQRGKTKGRFV